MSIDSFDWEHQSESPDQESLVTSVNDKYDFVFTHDLVHNVWVWQLVGYNEVIVSNEQNRLHLDGPICSCKPACFDVRHSFPRVYY